MHSSTHDSFQDKPGPCVLGSSTIYVVIGNRKRMANKHVTANFANLASIPRQPQSVPKNENTLTLALLNVRSLAENHFYIYRPPKYCATFFDDFTELLSIICINFDRVIIAGDFNIHVDNPQDRVTKELCCVFESYGLTQHVTQPTHNKGHTLDLIISKGLNISKVVVTDVALSDHSCVFFNGTISVPKSVQTKLIRKRYITENTSESFIQLFSSTPTLSGVSVTH